MIPLRNRRRATHTLVLLIVGVVWLLPDYAQSQDAQPGAPVETVEPSKDEDTPVLSTLKGLVDSMASIKKEQGETRQELEKLKIEKAEAGEIKSAEEKLERLKGDFDKLKVKFDQVATGITEETFEVKQREDFDLGKELNLLLEPIVYELRKTTDRPREIERLRADQLHFQKRKELVTAGLEKLDTLITQTNDPSLKEDLRKLQEGWKAQHGRISSELEAAQYQVDEALAKQESLLGVLGKFLRDFFANRGKSFLMAVVAALLVYLAFFLALRFIERATPAKDALKRSFAFRVFRLSVMGFGLLAASFTMLAVLYSQSDWLLLGLATIFLVGMAWAARKGLMPFYQQLKLMLNLGSVREGERVLFNGIPWEVQKIGLYTELENPLLTGGLVRVTLADLSKLHSRPKARREPLFPCKVGEWVKLADGTYGEVISQTPEMVRLRTATGSVKSFETASFLDQTPDNHSVGFGVRVEVGVDYQHQEIATTEIPTKLQEGVQEMLNNTVEQDQVEKLWVEFQAAGSSSLDYCIYVQFSGDLAGRKFFLQRCIQRAFVESCNVNDWTIPFPQITVHEAA